MEPFEDATNTIQGEKIVTSSKVIPCVVGLKHHLDNCEKETKNCAELIAALKASLEKRMKIYSDSKPFILATVLDPQFKNSCLNMSNEEACELLLDEMQNNPPKKTAEPAPDMPSTSSESPKKRRKLFSFLDEKKVNKLDEHNRISSEVFDYLKEPIVIEDISPLKYWENNENKYPNIAKIAPKYLTICASSAPVERLFSVAGKFYTSSRTLLKEDNFENLILIKLNKKM